MCTMTLIEVEIEDTYISVLFIIRSVSYRAFADQCREQPWINI